MSVRRIKPAHLRKNYHDARLTAVEVVGADISFVVEFNQAMNPDGSRHVRLTFCDVRNMGEVETILPPMQIQGTSWRPEIVGVGKADKTHFVVEIFMRESYSIEIDCRSVIET